MPRIEDLVARIRVDGSDETKRRLQQVGAQFDKLDRTAAPALTKLQGGFLKLSTGLSPVVASFDRFTGSVTRSAGALAGLGGAASIAGISALLKKALDTADGLAKAADRAGVAAESFQELNYAAGLAGVSTQDLETQLAKLNGRIGTAAAGGNNPFKQLGIDVRDAAGAARDATSVLEELADRYASAGSEAEKAAILTTAFGEEGRRLAPMLKGGADGLKSLREEARRLGMVIDEDLQRNAEALNDELSKLQLTIERNFQSGALRGMVGDFGSMKDLFADPEFAKSIQEIGYAVGRAARFVLENADQITRSIQALLGAVAAAKAAGLIGTAVGGPVGGAVGALGGAVVGGVGGYYATDIADSLIGEDGKPATGSGRPGSALPAASGAPPRLALGGGSGAGRSATDPLDRITKATQDARFELELLQSELPDVGKEIARNLYQAGLVKGLGDMVDTEAVTDYAEALRDLRAKQDEVAEATERRAKALRLVQEYQGEDAARAAQMAELQSLRPELVQVTGSENQADQILGRAVDALHSTKAETDAVFSEMEALGLRTFDKIGGAMIDAFARGKEGAVDWQSVTKSIIADVLQATIKFAIEAPLQQAFAPQAGAGAGAGAQPGAAGGSPWAAALSQLAGSALQAFTASLFHGGGTVGSGGGGRSVSPLAFVGARRFHEGGAVGLRSDEVPAILQKGELVVPKSALQGVRIPDMTAPKGSDGSAAFARPAVFNLNIKNNAGVQIDQQEKDNGTGGLNIDMVIGSAAARQMTQPGTAANRAMASTFGLKSRPVRR